jgi:hypothetical protein
LVTAALIAGLAVTIAALPTIQGGSSQDMLEWPTVIPRPIVMAALLGLPAAIALTGALRGSRSMLFSAGALALLQSFVAFSGVTLGFIIPGIVLITLSRAESADTIRSDGRARVAALLVVGLGIAAWFAILATSETVCWMARPGPDGTPVYTRIPETSTISVGPDEIGGGCDGGTLTAPGLLLGGAFGVGALATAWLAGGRRRGLGLAVPVER